MSLLFPRTSLLYENGDWESLRMINLKCIMSIFVNIVRFHFPPEFFYSQTSCNESQNRSSDRCKNESTIHMWKIIIQMEKKMSMDRHFPVFYLLPTPNLIMSNSAWIIQLQNLGSQSRRRVEGRQGSQEDCPSCSGRRQSRRRKLPLG